MNLNKYGVIFFPKLNRLSTLPISHYYWQYFVVSFQGAFIKPNFYVSLSQSHHIYCDFAKLIQYIH